jgi:hypothetical protein
MTPENTAAVGVARRLPDGCAELRAAARRARQKIGPARKRGARETGCGWRAIARRAGPPASGCASAPGPGAGWRGTSRRSGQVAPRARRGHLQTPHRGRAR